MISIPSYRVLPSFFSGHWPLETRFGLQVTRDRVWSSLIEFDRVSNGNKSHFEQRVDISAFLMVLPSFSLPSLRELAHRSRYSSISFFHEGFDWVFDRFDRFDWRSILWRRMRNRMVPSFTEFYRVFAEFYRESVNSCRAICWFVCFFFTEFRKRLPSFYLRSRFPFLIDSLMSIERNRVLPSFTEFSRDFYLWLVRTRAREPIIDFFYRVLSSFNEIVRNFRPRHQLGLDKTKLNRIVPSFTEFYRVLPPADEIWRDSTRFPFWWHSKCNSSQQWAGIGRNRDFTEFYWDSWWELTRFVEFLPSFLSFLPSFTRMFYRVLPRFLILSSVT